MSILLLSCRPCLRLLITCMECNNRDNKGAYGTTQIIDQMAGCSAKTAQKATIQQVTTMLATSKNDLFPGHNHLLTTGIDDLTL